MRKLLAWLGAWWDSEDHTQDVKLVAFFAVVVFAICKLAATKITADWVEAFYGLCALVGLGGTAWAAVEKWKGGKVATTTTEESGSSNQKGGEA